MFTSTGISGYWKYRLLYRFLPNLLDPIPTLVQFINMQLRQLRLFFGHYFKDLKTGCQSFL